MIAQDKVENLYRQKQKKQADLDDIKVTGKDLIDNPNTSDKNRLRQTLADIQSNWHDLTELLVQMISFTVSLASSSPVSLLWIKFSILTFSSFVLLLSVLLSPSCVYNITPPQFWYSYLSVSPHFHRPSSRCYSPSVFLYTWPNHLGIASLIFSLMFAAPAPAHISSLLIFSIQFFSIIPQIYIDGTGPCACAL